MSYEKLWDQSEARTLLKKIETSYQLSGPAQGGSTKIKGQRDGWATCAMGFLSRESGLPKRIDQDRGAECYRCRKSVCGLGDTMPKALFVNRVCCVEDRGSEVRTSGEALCIDEVEVSKLEGEEDCFRKVSGERMSRGLRGEECVIFLLMDRKERLTEEKWSCLDCERNVGMEECV